MWNEYINAKSVEQILDLLAEKKDHARIVAGGTDLIIEMDQGLHQDVDVLIDISRIEELSRIDLDQDGKIHIGAGVSHNQCLSSELIQKSALPLALACLEIGAPQIRNTGTVVGNLVTASPANDTIVPLYALNAELVLLSKSGQRIIKLQDFYTGVRKSILRSDELVSEIVFPALADNQSGSYIKLGLRKAQAISLVSLAAILTLDKQLVSSASITLGAVAPTIIHAEAAETYLVGKVLNKENIIEAAKLAQKAAQPIDDIRSSAAYRQETTRVLAERALIQVMDGTAFERLPDTPVLLDSSLKDYPKDLDETPLVEGKTPIITKINGKEFSFNSGHRDSLLHLIREEAGLTGSKVGCEEGECGACTIFLDGMAVMSCMVPAPRAHQAEIITIEGLGDEQHLHPVQESFIEEGAVQCGYCTPGFIMSAVKLLDEIPHPSQDEIKTAISGNLCRCTGYYKIVKAIEEASLKEGA
jgi:carbon-monoxide dehydrogenase medium subunit